jgi:hypothetical protein
MSKSASKLLVEASESLRQPLSFEEFLAKLPPKDRVNAEKRVVALEATGAPGLAELWRRVAAALMTLAPHAAKLVGKQTVQYYVADGKYRMQVFALEDLQDGRLTVYCPDVLADAVEAGLLAPPTAAEPGGTGTYGIVGTPDALRIDALDRDSLNPAAHFKDMVGWNRRALRLMLPPTASAEQVAAAELVCAIAARRFSSLAAAGATPPPGRGNARGA